MIYILDNIDIPLKIDNIDNLDYIDNIDISFQN